MDRFHQLIAAITTVAAVDRKTARVHNIEHVPFRLMVDHN